MDDRLKLIKVETEQNKADLENLMLRLKIEGLTLEVLDLKDQLSMAQGELNEFLTRMLH